MAVVDILKSVFSSGAGTLVTQVGDAVKQFVTTDKDRLELDQKLQQIVNAHSEKMAELAQTETESYLKDTADARAREIAITQASGASWLQKNITPLLASIVILLTFVMWYIVMFGKTAKESENVVLFVLGSLSTMTSSILAYYFGSSMGSKAKQEQLDKIQVNSNDKK